MDVYYVLSLVGVFLTVVVGVPAAILAILQIRELNRNSNVKQAAPPVPVKGIQPKGIQRFVFYPLRNRWVLPLLLVGVLIGILFSSLLFPQFSLKGVSSVSGASTSPTPTRMPSMTPTGTYESGTYLAINPGPGCDSGRGVWTIETGAKVTCTSNGMELASASNGPSAAVLFGGPWSGYSFPQNYSVSFILSGVASYVDPNIPICVGIVTRLPPTRVGGYSFFVCSNGSWYVKVGDFNGGQTSLAAQGTTDLAKFYRDNFLVKVHDSIQEFSVNSTVLYSLDNSAYENTAFIGLEVSTLTTLPIGSVYFSNFLYTPMS